MATQGILLPGGVSGEYNSDILVYARRVFFNEAPLVMGLPRVMTGADSFKMGAAKVRARTTRLGAALADNTNTTVNLVNASEYQIGDVLQLNSGERVEITADPTITNTTSGAGTVAVRRGVEGTTAAAQTNNTVVTLISNSRTGAEIDQTGVRVQPTFITQYIQTFQYPVQAGGKVNAMSNVVSPDGGSVFTTNQRQRLVEMYRDMEHSALYQIGETGVSRPKQKGLRQILVEGGASVTTSPTNASSYSVTDLYRDAVQPVLDAGGRIDTLLVSVGMSQGFNRWGWSKLQVRPDDTAVGAPTQKVMVPFLNYPIVIQVDFSLRGNTVVAISSTDGAAGARVRCRFLRQEFWNERGNRGDAIEGDWIADFGLDVDDPTHHAWVENITGFANA